MVGYSSALVLNAGLALAVVTLAFSLMLLVVSAVSYSRLRSAKLLIVGGAFAVLAVKGGLATYGAVVDRSVDLVGVILDFGILAFLYASVAVR